MFFDVLFFSLFLLVFMIFPGIFMVFHGFWFTFIVVQGILMVLKFTMSTDGFKVYYVNDTTFLLNHRNGLDIRTDVFEVH